MIHRLTFILLLCSACSNGLIPCPEPKGIKYRRNAGNYRKIYERSLSASNRGQEEEGRDSRDYSSLRQTRSVKSVETIEEWDCPKPGSKTIPRSVRDNIRKNRKKFETYYRNRSYPDSAANRQR
jgi:hypothetical protein